MIKTGVACSVVVMLGGLGGCAPDLYLPCQLDTASTNPKQAQCANARENVTCTVENFSQCDTRVCGRYEGSEGFCTQKCTSDADCGDGQCRDFNIIQPGTARYCVAPEAL